MKREFDLSFEEVYWICTSLGRMAIDENHAETVRKFFCELKKGDV